MQVGVQKSFVFVLMDILEDAPVGVSKMFLAEIPRQPFTIGASLFESFEPFEETDVGRGASSLA